MSPREQAAAQILATRIEPPDDDPDANLNRFSLGYAAGWNAAAREAARIVRGDQ